MFFIVFAERESLYRNLKCNQRHILLYKTKTAQSVYQRDMSWITGLWFPAGIRDFLHYISIFCDTDISEEPLPSIAGWLSVYYMTLYPRKQNSSHNGGYEIFIFWDMMFSPLKVNWHIRGTCHLHLQSWSVIFQKTELFTAIYRFLIYSFLCCMTLKSKHIEE
jgi:hypothetical protein